MKPNARHAVVDRTIMSSPSMAMSIVFRPRWFLASVLTADERRVQIRPICTSTILASCAPNLGIGSGTSLSGSELAGASLSDQGDEDLHLTTLSRVHVLKSQRQRRTRRLASSRILPDAFRPDDEHVFLFNVVEGEDLCRHRVAAVPEDNGQPILWLQLGEGQYQTGSSCENKRDGHGAERTRGDTVRQQETGDTSRLVRSWTALLSMVRPR